MSFQRVISQTHAVSYFQGVISRGRLGHAYVFYGPEGVGKALFARELAKALFCQTKGDASTSGGLPSNDACDVCNPCRKVDSGMHPDLWAAACDMFGPYDLITFSERIPETWKPYFAIALGDPQKDRDFLVDRSPRTHIENLKSPMLVIQGKNDPRVVEAESRDLVEHLRKMGKDIEYLMFPDEGHDVLTFENRVRCYSAIVEFFQKHLKP